MAEQETILERLLADLTYVKAVDHHSQLWPRVILLGVLGLWGLWFIRAGIDWRAINSSFLHSVNLPFHEFGHVLFSPFGQFWMFLGGSLFQIMMPLIAAACFVWQRQDNFAAGCMLWWAGQNFIDVAPYIADARVRAMPLIGGLSDESHDWGNILVHLDALQAAPALARCAFTIGILLMAMGLAWGAYILRKQWITVDLHH